MQFAGMNRAKCLQCGGTKCITYSCVCPKTLTGLKRLMEVIADGDGRLSIVLVGHPKLRNDLRRPTMEEIGYRTSTFAFDGIAGQQREYITWLLQACAAEGVGPGDLVADAAV